MYPEIKINNLISQLSLRRINKKDLPLLEWGGEFSHFKNLYKDIYQNSLIGNVILWGMEMQKFGIIGQLFVQLKSNQLKLADGHSNAYIFGFRIRQPFQGFGLGTNMLTNAEEDIIQRKFRRITLHVSKTNKNAMEFYKHRGYCVIGSVPGIWSYINDKGRSIQVNDPSWRLQKKLKGV